MPEVTLDSWNKFIAVNPAAHLLQTGPWGELKASFGWQPVRVVCEVQGVQILFKDLPFQLRVAYLPKPAMELTTLTRKSALWQELISVCRRKRAVFLKIEPDEWQDSVPSNQLHPPVRSPDEPRIRRSAYNIQPPRTAVVDLRGSEDDLLGRMKQKCRYNIRLAEKKGVTVEASEDLDGFFRLMKLTGGRDAFAVHSAAYYRRAYELFHASGNCELLVARYAGEPLAALMVFRQGPRAWYLYGASSDLERSRMPTYLLQWAAMRWAMAHGCLEYDLWGVPDEDEDVLEAQFETRQDGLWGVYRFKRGFGGQLRRAAQAVDVVFNPLLYRLYLWRMAGREAA